MLKMPKIDFVNSTRFLVLPILKTAVLLYQTQGRKTNLKQTPKQTHANDYHNAPSQSNENNERKQTTTRVRLNRM